MNLLKAGILEIRGDYETDVWVENMKIETDKVTIFSICVHSDYLNISIF